MVALAAQRHRRHCTYLQYPSHVLACRGRFFEASLTALGRFNMSQTIIVVDAFTDKPFAGNPAAVCVLEKPADETWMKHVAAEMNLSETAFLHPEADGWRLRWLTPSVEVDLCGHSTLA